MNRIDLEGQVAVVTGGAQGIGFAVAQRLVASGARVSLWDTNVELLRDAVAALGEAASSQTVDITDLAALGRAHAAVEAEVGPVSILVNSAGIAGKNATLDEYDPDEWRRVVEINLNGTFYVNRTVVPGMKARNYGRIVNIASIAGKEGNPNLSAYSAAKAGVIGLTKSLGKELAKHDIAVNAITPATARTRILETLTPEFIDYMLVRIPRAGSWRSRRPPRWWPGSSPRTIPSPPPRSSTCRAAEPPIEGTPPMKLLRVGQKGRERPAIRLEDGTLRDLSSLVDDIAGEALSDESLAKIRAADLGSLPTIEGDERIGPCVGRVGKFICVGLNYADHAAESGMAVPSEPVLFMKATSAIVGPNDDVVIPKGSIKPDWEVELGVVIGTEARYVSEADALDHVAGYCVVNDISERHFQTERGGQWVKGKSADTFGPIGPWLVTRDEVADPQALSMWLEVDGHRYQDGSTKTMVFGVAHLVHYISQFMSLQPGDIITTGTPPGVGMGIKPEPVWLKAGNVMRLGIEGLGEQRQDVKAYAG